ncbi:MAG TPA: hypothetical protein VNF91_10130 [Candidatus Acidoferrum sp.]|nr:hypothetical protein [Candidatus Acidoferrum sp.]HXJ49514.1 hypothetical protein [Candidatus Acidoferrum sp.]
MSRTRRLALTVLSAGVVTAVSFVTGATLIAASVNSPAAAGGKGGCGIGAGQCTITQLDAFAFWFTGDPTNPQQVSIDAVRSTFVMRSPGGPAVITPFQTMVNVSVFSAITGTGTGACFVIPDSQFAVSSDLQHASLNATLTADETCGGALTPLLSSLQAAPFAGGGPPPGGGLALPLTVNVTWTGPGLAFKSTTNATQTCGGFTSSFHTQGASSQANANGNTLVFGDGSSLALGSTLSAGVDNFRSSIISNGFPGPQCLAS